MNENQRINKQFTTAPNPLQIFSKYLEKAIIKNIFLSVIKMETSKAAACEFCAELFLFMFFLTIFLLKNSWLDLDSPYLLNGHDGFFNES